jgi:ABC-type bacteriocin/lantibiotic exporter with double-glycine peptidase domain
VGEPGPRRHLTFAAMVAVIGVAGLTTSGAESQYPFLPSTGVHVLDPQHDLSLNCGPYALYLACRQLGVEVPLQRVVSLTRRGRLPATIESLEQAAEAVGLRAACAKVGLEDLCYLPMPAVAYLRSPEGIGHFVALLDACPDSVLIVSAPRPQQWVSTEKLREQWDDKVLVLSRGAAPLSALRRRRLARAALHVLGAAAGIVLV